MTVAVKPPPPEPDVAGRPLGSAVAEPRRPSPVRRLELFLVRPTKYDDDGYLLRHWLGVLPTNTLACLDALSVDVRRCGALGAVELRVHRCDESVQALPERAMRRAARRRGVRVVVALVGVQTSQFPRATDIARRLRARGYTVLLGGFHVSGSLAMLPATPPDLEALMAAGVTLVKGEVEDVWPRILRDAADGRLARLYDTGEARPDLRSAPVPRVDRRMLRRFAHRGLVTLDAGRGCPFVCSFCTIINVQGRSMRTRDAGAIAAAVEATYRETGVSRWFFTDDNFARNPSWRAIFLELVRLRERAGIPVRFLMQVDLLADRIPEFVALAREAGCFQVFLGMESLNPRSVRAAGKHQNRTADYARVIETWRRAGIITHAGYIIGFPDDTPASVAEDLRTLCEDVRPDVASFFMLTPLPGSVDHRRMSEAGTAMDADWNRYDTFHPVTDHPAMSRDEWSRLYRDAWRDFYTPAYMRERIASLPAEQRITLLQIYLWYRAASVVESFHPMMTGFLRRKSRWDRRSGYAVESVVQHLRRRVPELAAALFGYARILRELGDVWTATADTIPATRAAQWRSFLTEMFVGATHHRADRGQVPCASADDPRLGKMRGTKLYS